MPPRVQAPSRGQTDTMGLWDKSVRISLVSDRPKALIKLAHTGLGCLSTPDVFHLSHDLAKGYALAIFGRLRHAKQDFDHATQRLETLQQPEDKPAVAYASRGGVPCAGLVCAHTFCQRWGPGCRCL